jgi:hypothetical protein
MVGRGDRRLLPVLTPKPVAGMIDERVIVLLFEVVFSDLSRIDGTNAPATKELSFPVAYYGIEQCTLRRKNRALVHANA